MKDKNAEERIAEQAALLDKARDAILVVDMSGKIVYWNKSAERLYGWTSSETLGLSASALWPAMDLTLIKKSLLENGEWSGELTLRRKDQGEVIIESRKTLVHDKNGNPKSVLIVQTDISERKRYEMKFLRAQRLESVGALASGIAHDLNNIFTPLLMCSDLLRQTLTSAEDKQLLEMLQANAQRGGELVKQILTFARGTDGQRKSILIKYTIKELENLIRQTFPRSIRLKTSVPNDLWPIMGDAAQLHQVIMNLVVNARDAMPNGGTLKIEAQNLHIDTYCAPRQPEARPGDYVVLKVSDDGVGMRPEVLCRVFEPFFTTKEPGKGTGLGLSTVLGIVKAHQGFIDVDSEPGKGTVFSIFLPATPIESQVAPSTDSVALPCGNNDLVMFVDDEEAIRHITKLTLEAYGYRVLLAGDGSEAIALSLRHKGQIKLVITDSMMPGMDGPATVRALKRLEPELKFLAVSGMTIGNRASYIAYDDNIPFLPKPYTTRALLTIVFDVMHNQKQPSRFPDGNILNQLCCAN